MKYREKSEIIEAVKWDGKLETIEKNEWLEDALKGEKIIVAVDKLTDKECTILMRYFGGGSYEKVKLGEYIVKREREEGYEMKHVEAEEFEKRFEPLPEEIHGYIDWGSSDGHRNGTCMYTGTTVNKKVERLGE